MQLAHLSCTQAILSPFARQPTPPKAKKKATQDDNDVADDSDDEEADAFADLQVEDDEEDLLAAEDVDEDREAADAAVIQEIGCAIDAKRPLTPAQLKLGQYTLSKVCLCPVVTSHLILNR